MIQYRIRTPFRIAAWLPGLVLTPAGVVFAVIGAGAVIRGEFSGVLGLALAGVAGAIGVLCLRVALTGRAPAWLEEYGLHDPTEIQDLRAAARDRGVLEE